ncbi:MAG TPA: fatty acid cis/trans isomerase, partial [Gammaproteobacteria bacterium]|nr:fatty acid cis/trans isomerase [Gammaproteobacteria bacterium]
MMIRLFRNNAPCLILLMLPVLVAGCMQRTAVTGKTPERPVSPVQTYSYTRDIQPILEQKCIACHGCYDAPCQLKLTSAAGLLRGATKKPVYNGARLTDAAPTRLFIDANTTAEWRGKGFYPVLNEQGGSLDDNLERSLLYDMIHLGKKHPLPAYAPVPDHIQLGLQRKSECPLPGKFDDYARKNPQQGMPLAMTGLSDREFAALRQWIREGAVIDAQ